MRLLLVAATTALVGVVSACSSVVDGSGSGGPSGASPSDTATPTFATPSGGPSMVLTTAASSSAAPTTPTVQPPPTTPLRIVTVKNTISGATYVIKVWADRSDPTCADHAYGAPVIKYLKDHPCGGLQRLLATTTVKGKAVGFAESRLGFVGQADAVYKVASDFVQLVTQEGTGNVSDLLRDGKRLPSGPTAVPSPDAFYAQGQDAGVVIDDIWYLNGSTPANDPPLIQFAKDIFLQFG